MSDAPKAVFLSYASQDAEAAKRICDALRAAGVEVWFDQSELVGGDQWDTKIRGQINSCALFVPVISATTQARLEGYFRLEWKLAAQRTHTMADEMTFLLPVVIDATRDAEAKVPAEFKTVQWTKLPAGETPPAFCSRVQRLLGGSEVEAGRPRPAEHSEAAAAPAREVFPWKFLLLGGLAFFVTGTLMYLVFKPRRSPEEIARIIAEARALGEVESEKAAKATADAKPAPAPLSAARLLVERARPLIYEHSALRADFDTATGLLEQAAKLDPNDASVWAQWAVLDSRYLDANIDHTDVRKAQATAHAARALSLDPGSRDARFAQAAVIVPVSDYSPAANAEAEKWLRPLVTEDPNDAQALLKLAYAIDGPVRLDEALALFDRAALLPGTAPEAALGRQVKYFFSAHFEDADKAGGSSLAREHLWEALTWKIYLTLKWRGDVDQAARLEAEFPASWRLEPFTATISQMVYAWRREPSKAIGILRALPYDYLQSIAYDGPKARLIGDMLELDGRADAARIEWRAALQLIEQRLAATPNEQRLLEQKIYVLTRLGEHAEAGRLWKTDLGLYGDDLFSSLARREIMIYLEPPDHTLDVLETIIRNRPITWDVPTAAELRLDPVYDPLRKEPRFAALLAHAEADPRLSQQAQASAIPALSSLLPATALPPPVDAKSVAVLAFTNLSDDKANEYFSDGISEELLNVLAKIPGLKVAARTSAFYFKGKEVPVPEIAKQLGVAYVVEGSVRKSGSHVRITAQLISAADGFHVWSDNFDRDLKDIFVVQDEIAGLIARNISPKLGITQAATIAEINPEAFQEYLAGRAAAVKAGKADLQEAVAHFERAVALEPKYTAAWVQLASAHTQLGRWGGAPTLQAWSAARVAIDRARALEPDSPDVLLALGWILRTADWDWKGAEQAFRRALVLRPNQPEVVAGAAVLLYNIGRTEESFRLGRQAVQLDPLNAATQIDLSIMFVLHDDWAEAERSVRRALQLAPGGSGYHNMLAWTLIKQQRYDEAEAEAGRETDERERAAGLGLLALARGQGTVVRENLAQLEAIARKSGDIADLQQYIAWLCAGLGENDRAFAALEKARASRDPSMSWLRNGRYLEPLFPDPRWAALLHQVGLADEQLK